MDLSIVGRTIGELVVERPSRSRVFGKLGIDFCCGGRRSLAEACSAHALDPADVARLIAEAEQEGEAPNEWAEAPLAAVCDHLVATHHAFTKEELPRLEALLDKVARVHGERHPQMIEVAELFRALAAELSSHLAREEGVLFPAIRALEGAPSAGLMMPIRVMMREHDDAGEVFRRLRELTGDFVTPEGGCNTFRAALSGLADLEEDLHRHVHLENEILFPRALGRS